MKILIKEIKDTDFDPGYKMGDPKEYAVRPGSRGILVDGDKIALLNVTKYNYHKLPGGGIEKGESIEEAFRRETIEEVGVDCEILDQGGIIIEWRDRFKILQINYIFFAKVVGKVGKNKFEQDEIDEGFKLEWVPITELGKVFKDDKPANYEGKFITIRDKAIIEFYKNRLK